MQTNQSQIAMKAMSDNQHQIGSIVEATTMVSRRSTETAAFAEESNRQLDQITTHMSLLGESVRDSQQHIHTLQQRSQDISQITTFIQELAAQTQLLALNASIESARAGEAGSGFAVVAQEIQQLAHQSSSSATQIASFLSEMTADTDRSAVSMNQVTSRLEAGMEATRHTKDSLEKIWDYAADVDAGVQDILQSSQQVSATTHQVVRSVEHIAEIAGKFTDSCQNTHQLAQDQHAVNQENIAIAQDLNTASHGLQYVIEQLKAD